MTAAQLNRDIKKLANEFYRLSFENADDQYDFIEGKGKKEFMRLYNADENFEYMNLQSVKLMLRLNLRHRFVALHNFGLKISLKP